MERDRFLSGWWIGFALIVGIAGWLLIGLVISLLCGVL